MSPDDVAPDPPPGAGRPTRPADVTGDREAPAWAREAHPREGEPPPGDLELLGSFFTSLTDELTRGFTGSTVRRLGKTALRGGMALFRPENLDRAAEAGRSIRDAREVAGLTLKELAEALELQDESVLDAVEKGTATVSFELLLRLASLLARHDPVPFVMRYLRTYDPAVWQFLQDWGLGRLPLAYERERRFINIYRKRDAARALDEEAFERLVGFTERAFELALEELTGHRELEEELKRTRAELEAERAELAKARAALARAASTADPATR